MNKRRVVVTGMGVVSPIGITVTDFWKNLISGVSGVKPIQHFEIPKNMSSIAGMVQDFHPESLRVDLPYTEKDRVSHFALHAIHEALRNAKLDKKSLASFNCRAGLVLSSAVSQITGMERCFRDKTQGGTVPLPLSNNYLYKNNPYLFNNVINEMTKELGIKGRSLLLPTGCAGGIDAITYAVQAIQNHYADIIISGAVEAPITPLVVAAFNKIGAMSTRYNATPEKASRPFDQDRDGFVLGEGCGILILESLDSALERNATIYAEIAGTGSVNNCHHMTDIPQDGMPIAKASLHALHEANVCPDDIDFINSHGSSTQQNDIAESNAFKILFGDKSKTIPVTSNKSILGHALSASNALEVISSVKSIEHNCIPPTINLENQDSRCDVNVIRQATDYPMNCILKTSSGFSGIHSSLVIRRM